MSTGKAMFHNSYVNPIYNKNIDPVFIQYWKMCFIYCPFGKIIVKSIQNVNCWQLFFQNYLTISRKKVIIALRQQNISN